MRGSLGSPRKAEYSQLAIRIMHTQYIYNNNRHRIRGINPLTWFALFNKLISQESNQINEKETIKSREEFSSIKGYNERKNSTTTESIIFMLFWRWIPSS